MRKRLFPLWAWILTGFLAAGRAFAYIGVPPLFIGEAYLAWNVMRNRHNWLGRIVDDLIRFDLLTVGVVANLAWGGVEIIRSILMGRAPLDVVRTAALDYYPLYVLAGIAIGYDVTIHQFVRAWKILTYLYCPYVIVACYLQPLTDFNLGQAGLSPIVPIVTLALWPYLLNWRLRHVMFLLSLHPIIFAYGHGRGPLLGFLFGSLAVVLVCKIPISRLIGYVTSALLVGFIFGPFVPGPGGQSPPLDPVVHCARLVGTFDPALAAKMLDLRGYHEEAAIIGVAEGTAKWRQIIWMNAIHSLNTTSLQWLGQGHGTSLRDMTPSGEDITTPHNFTIYCLFYTGVVGLVVFCFFLVTLLIAGKQIQNQRLRAAMPGVVWATILIAATGDCFETPYGAVPFYLLCGLILGMSRSAEARSKRAAAEIAYRQPQVIENIGFRQNPASVGR